jgi:AcrR family transcriptional regulator
MDDLATELAMSKKTLYAHFASKSALVEAVILDKFRDAAANLEAVTSVAADDFMASLQQLLIRLQKQMAEIQPSFVRDIQREEPEMFKLIQRRRQELIQRHFGKLLDEGRKQGLIRKDIPVNLIIEILIGAANAIMNPEKLEGMGLTVQNAGLSVIRIILQGALTQKAKNSL